MLPLISTNGANYHFDQNAEPEFIEHDPLVQVSLDSPLELISNSEFTQTKLGKQFNYHLKDLGVVPFRQRLYVDGTVTLHLPNYKTKQLEFFGLETADEFRSRIESTFKIDISSYYLVSKNGIMKGDQKLDSYGIKNGAVILFIPKESRSKNQKIHQQVLDKHEKRMELSKQYSSTIYYPLKCQKTNSTPISTPRQRSSYQ